MTGIISMKDAAIFHRAIRSEELAAEDGVAVELEGKTVLICQSKGEYFAVENRCSHAEEKLECGRIRRGSIACPMHGARFDLASGRPLNPPATEPIKTYAVRLLDGWIEVAL
ncbi:MAG TPA: non-heme iron oxygenase ferredoxin subunit [Rhizorhapis sp.]|nr:non-heme iron oxygenase ferredoxin subunit [Rhizorhapis sp.]